MTFAPHGKHLIGGEWVGSDRTFENEPVQGPADRFSMGTVDLVDRAARAAEDAFWSYGYGTRADRAAFLNAIADEIEVRAADITEIGYRETGLPEARLNGERGRTTSQLRLCSRRRSSMVTIWTGGMMRRCRTASRCRARTCA